MELVKYSGFVYEILTLLAWLTHTGSKKSCLSKRPTKMAQQGLVNGGWYGDQGLFPYSGGESLTQAHTGGHRGYFSSLTAKEKDMHALTNTTTTPYSMRVCNSV